MVAMPSPSPGLRPPSPGGRGTLDGVEREQLAGELQRKHDAYPERPVLVRGDTSVKYGEIAGVVDSCRLAGFKDVSLATIPSEP